MSSFIFAWSLPMRDDVQYQPDDVFMFKSVPIGESSNPDGVSVATVENFCPEDYPRTPRSYAQRSSIGPTIGASAHGSNDQATMSQNIDPRLGSQPGASSSTRYGKLELPPPPPPPATAGRVDSLRAESGGYGAHQSPQPYYYHFSSSRTQTPTQQPGTVSSASRSNQASPDGAYHIPADDDASPRNAGGAAGDEAHEGDDPKRPRACEACRGLKVRCDQDPAHPELPCKRCAKAGRQCIITQPSRKRQKKADSRVAELEKKLDALTAALHQQQQPPASLPPLPPPPPSASPNGAASQYAASQTVAPPATMAATTVSVPSASEPLHVPLSKRRRTDDPLEHQPFEGTVVSCKPEYPYSAPLPTPIKEEEKPGSECRDLSSGSHLSGDLRRFLHGTTPEEFTNHISSLVSGDMAAKIFNRYVTEMAPKLPAVVFPPGTTAEQLFKEKPILYVCILSASSSGMLQQDVAKQLSREAIGAIADCVVRSGAKSLELIQAMQAIALWYKPPEIVEQTNFYQIIHMAAVMALDIGLGKRFNPAKARRGFGGPNANFAPGPGKVMPQDSDTLEARRAWLGCYYLCASASMVLRRPNLVRWTNYMKECIEVLETHPDAFPSDKFFCQHVKIQHINEDIGLQFLMDDSSANVSITDPKVSYALKVLENQLKTWKENVPSDCRGPILTFFEHVTSLYLHEIALHMNHNIDDFRLPFTEESLKSVNNSSETLTLHQMAAIEACVKGAHGILNTMLSMDIDTIRSLPMLLFFVRCIYAVVILIKMHVAASSPGSELGKIVKTEDLKVDYYFERLIQLFGQIKRDSSAPRPHPKVIRILSVLRQWFANHIKNLDAQQRGEGGVQTTETNLRAGQTPLHLLSQVATGDSSEHRQSHQTAFSSATQASDWTFNTPTVLDYAKRPNVGATFENRLQMNLQQPSSSLPPQVSSVSDTNSGDTPSFSLPPDFSATPGLVDPTIQDYGWGSGFEQAMDIMMGGTEGFQGESLDGWFLGDGVAPFSFVGDTVPVNADPSRSRWSG